VLNPVVHPTLAETSWPVHSSFAGGAGVAAGAEKTRESDEYREPAAGPCRSRFPRAVCPWPQEGQALLSADTKAAAHRLTATRVCAPRAEPASGRGAGQLGAEPIGLRLRPHGNVIRQNDGVALSAAARDQTEILVGHAQVAGG
jgi:hypothetical protein